MQDVQEQLRHWEEQLRGAQIEAKDAQVAHLLATERDRAARMRLEALSKVVAGLRELVNAQGAPQEERLPIQQSGTNLVRAIANGAGEVSGEAPRGQEAVRRVLAESRKPWRVKDLVEEIERRGWIDPGARNKAAAVSIAVRRLLDADKVDRVGIGTYQIAAKELWEHFADMGLTQDVPREEQEKGEGAEE